MEIFKEKGLKALNTSKTGKSVTKEWRGLTSHGEDTEALRQWPLYSSTLHSPISTDHFPLSILHSRPSFPGRSVSLL